MDYRKRLDGFRPERESLICIDSDGCAFDTMGIKQRECFCPWMIAYFHLQPVARAARECKEFADLYSKTRGANRHVTIKRILSDLLPSHPHTEATGFRVPQFPHYFKWVDDPESVLSNDGLKRAIAAASDQQARDELAHVLQWSERVNWSVKEIVKGIPPFPHVKESLEYLSSEADMIVVSATPLEALEREWTEHGLARHLALICGQEMGTKREQIAAASKRYAKERVLMIGDAPGDMDAARGNNVLFYPIVPGSEIDAWREFLTEGVQRFLNGEYAGEYEQTLIQRFEDALPDRPEWEVRR